MYTAHTDSHSSCVHQPSITHTPANIPEMKGGKESAWQKREMERINETCYTFNLCKATKKWFGWLKKKFSSPCWINTACSMSGLQITRTLSCVFTVDFTNLALPNRHYNFMRRDLMWGHLGLESSQKVIYWSPLWFRIKELQHWKVTNFGDVMLHRQWSRLLWSLHHMRGFAKKAIKAPIWNLKWLLLWSPRSPKLQ